MAADRAVSAQAINPNCGIQCVRLIYVPYVDQLFAATAWRNGTSGGSEIDGGIRGRKALVKKVMTSAERTCRPLTCKTLSLIAAISVERLFAMRIYVEPACAGQISEEQC